MEYNTHSSLASIGKTQGKTQGLSARLPCLPTARGSLVPPTVPTKTVLVAEILNDVSQLPPEMLRKGRWDELFFVDLPNQTEREAIWKIPISKYGRDAKDFDLVQLARITEGLAGSEVESCFVEALYAGFDQDTEPTDLTIAQVLADFMPLSKLMAEQIAALRNWAKGRTTRSICSGACSAMAASTTTATSPISKPAW